MCRQALSLRVRLLLFLCCAGLAQLLAAQNGPPPNALAGKRVAVYVSKKGVMFSEQYNKMLGHYLTQQDSLGLSEEEIRQGVSIKLGNDLVALLQEKFKTKQAYFINAMPELARAVIAAGDGAESLRDAAPLLEAQTDYVLVLEQYYLTGEYRNAVYTISNRMYNERRFAQLAFVTARVYDGRGQLVHQLISHTFDGDRVANATAYYTPAPDAGPAQRHNARILNGFFYRLFASWPS